MSDRTIHFDFNAIHQLYLTLSQEVASMQETMTTVLQVSNQVGESWSGHAYDQFQTAVTDWKQYGQLLLNDLTHLRDRMNDCANSFQTRDAEFAKVWMNTGS